MNPVTGEKAIRIAGVDYVMRFTWRALAEVEAKHGDSPNLFNPEVVASVASAGMRDRHPEMTAERIMDLSPPLVPFAHSVQEALKWAYLGPMESIIGEDGGSVKKNRMADGLWRLIRRLCKLALARLSSGR
jgi:hypothetical protein